MEILALVIIFRCCKKFCEISSIIVLILFFQETQGINIGRDTSGLYTVLLGFTTLLTSKFISVAFSSEREKPDKFCSEALISACSFTSRKSTTRDPRVYFPSEGSHTQDFYALKKKKNPSTQAGFEPANLGSSGECDNHGTTGDRDRLDSTKIFISYR